MKLKPDRIIIQPITIKDRENILHLVKQSGVFNEKEIEVAIEVIEETLFSPEQSEYFVFCAFNDHNQLMGFICFGPIPMTEGCYDLYWIVVDQKFSRNGVGEKLLYSMEDFVKKEKARRIYIDTSSTRPYAAARAFYKKHGFQIVTKLKDFYREGDHKVIFMKELSSNTNF